MPGWTQERYQYTIAANSNANCARGSGTLGGIFVSSASNTPLLTVQDAASVQAANGNAIVAEYVPTVGWNRMPFGFQNGLQVRCGGNVVYTVAWNN